VPALEAVSPPGGVSAWRHLSYAWQWWLFAAAAIVFWVAFVRAGVRDRRPAPAVDAADTADPPR
jgi:cytochrome oxidase assembly protein ShyY1